MELIEPAVWISFTVCMDIIQITMSVRSSSLQTTGERVPICRCSVLQALTLAFRNALYACQSVFAIPALFCFWAK